MEDRRLPAGGRAKVLLLCDQTNEPLWCSRSPNTSPLEFIRSKKRGGIAPTSCRRWRRSTLATTRTVIGPFISFTGKPRRPPRTLPTWLRHHQQRGLCEHFERHDAGVIEHAFDGVVEKEGWSSVESVLWTTNFLALVKRYDLVNERETGWICDGSGHGGWKLERCMRETTKAVHEPEGHQPSTRRFPPQAATKMATPSSTASVSAMPAAANTASMEPRVAMPSVPPARPSDNGGSACLTRRGRAVSASRAELAAA